MGPTFRFVLFALYPLVKVGVVNHLPALNTGNIDINVAGFEAGQRA
jgi:hypothetical protein